MKKYYVILAVFKLMIFSKILFKSEHHDPEILSSKFWKFLNSIKSTEKILNDPLQTFTNCSKNSNSISYLSCPELTSEYLVSGSQRKTINHEIVFLKMNCSETIKQTKLYTPTVYHENNWIKRKKNYQRFFHFLFLFIPFPLKFFCISFFIYFAAKKIFFLFLLFSASMKLITFVR